MDALPETTHVGICGGGIGGLILAYALSKHTHLRISVYEANSELAGTGTGLGIFRRTLLILYELGLAEAMDELCGPPSHERKSILLLRDSNQVMGQTIGEVLALGGMKGARRTAFHSTLIAALRQRVNVTLHTSKRAIRYDETRERVNVHFADGSAEQVDILVGADGLHSAIRKSMVQAVLHVPSLSKGPSVPVKVFRLPEGNLTEASDEGEDTAVDLTSYQGAVWSGFLVNRTVVPRERLEAVNPAHRLLTATMILYTGKDKYITVFPISRGAAINVSLYVFDPVSAAARAPYTGRSIKNVNIEEVVSLFGSDWEPEVMELLSCLDGLEVSCWAVTEVEDLPTYASGRVVLLGDAAHAMTPNLGMGAGQAIEDSYVLAALLSHPKALSHTDAALATYSRVRRPFVQDVVRLAWKVGLYYAHRSLSLSPLEVIPEKSTHTDTESNKREVQTQSSQAESIAIDELARQMTQMFGWVGESAEAQVERALEIFERTIAVR